MHISNLVINRALSVVVRIEFIDLLARTLTSAVLAAACLAVPVHAQSLFGAIDPFKADKKVSPAPNQRWIPEEALPAVPAPANLQTLPAELNKPLSLAELTEIALSL